MNDTTLGAPLSRAVLAERLATVPRVPLAATPTPLEYCPRLGEAIGGIELYVKRDDLTGLAFGGNKTRQLEYLFADVLAQGADVVVAGAYTQSNWCRQIAAAARRLGLDASLVLMHGEKGPLRQGNLLLDELLGAEVEVVALTEMAELSPLLAARAEVLRARGRHPYVVDPGALATLARSALGYVGAALELDEQLEARGLSADHLYLSGANMTPAGLALGLRALGRSTRVVGITPIRWPEPRSVDIARIASATADLLGLDVVLDPQDICNDEDYVGERYGVVSEASRAALLLAARSEGLILDPVYTSKALAGLIGHVERGLVQRGECVVFVHTGGLPALFAYAEDLLG